MTKTYAYNAVTTLYWNGSSFSAETIEQAKPVDDVELITLKHVYLNVMATSV